MLNHLNGRLDPLLLMVRIMRPIAFLANPLARLCMDAFGALPVFRQRDLSMPQMWFGQAAVTSWSKYG